MTQLSIILPTLNERENLPITIRRILETMKGYSFEIIVVDDDSEDGTWQVARCLSQQHENVRLIRRVHRRGLASAIVDGFLSGKGAFLAVLDADRQHDVGMVPKMLQAMEPCDLVIGSRYLHQKRVPGWSPWRCRFSQWASNLSRFFLAGNLTDPLSGFFMIRNSLFHEIAPRLRPRGFKLLLEILLRCPELRVKELHYDFGARLQGSSKLDVRVILDFAIALFSRTFQAR